MIKSQPLPELLPPQQAAILLLRLIETRADGAQPATRVRLSELTLRRLWGRSRINREFIEEVQEWLWRGGWSLFYAQNTYAAIKTSSVQNWVRLSSKRLDADLKLVEKGEFEFEKHMHLILPHSNNDSDD
jgi:hypothetical protein